MRHIICFPSPSKLMHACDMHAEWTIQEQVLLMEGAHCLLYCVLNAYDMGVAFCARVDGDTEAQRQMLVTGVEASLLPALASLGPPIYPELVRNPSSSGSDFVTAVRSTDPRFGNISRAHRGAATSASFPP